VKNEEIQFVLWEQVAGELCVETSTSLDCTATQQSRRRCRMHKANPKFPKTGEVGCLLWTVYQN